MNGAKILGVRNMTDTLKKIANEFPNRVEAAAYTEMEIEATEMKRRTPVDTRAEAPHPGQLRNSIHVLPPEREGRKITVTVATGEEAPYGIYVHENLEAFHPVGQAKFMESVLNESVDHMGQRIANRVRLGEEK